VRLLLLLVRSNEMISIKTEDIFFLGSKL